MTFDYYIPFAVTALYPMSKIHYAPNPFYPPLLPGVAYTPWDELRSYEDIKALNISYPFAMVPLDYQVCVRCLLGN